MAQVQTCSRCGKLFDEETSFHRHVEYCRRRAARQQAPRKIACQACRRIKSKCDFHEPCSRCSLKGIPCSYGRPGGTSINEQKQPDSVDAAGGHADMSYVPTDNTHIDTSSAVNLAFTSGENTGPYPSLDTSSDLTAFLNTVRDGQEQLAYLNADIANEQALSSVGYGKMVRPINLAETSLVPVQSNKGYQVTEFFSQQPPLNSIWPYGPCSLMTTLATMGTTGLPSHSSDDPAEVVGSINIAGKTFPSKSSQQLVICIARTYPRMMTQLNNLPPFVHFLHCDPSYWLQSFLSRSLPSSESSSGVALPVSDNPLAVCVQLSHLFISRGSNATDLWRRTMLAEQRRIEQLIHNFSQAENVAATQAMIMYTIMILTERDHDYVEAQKDIMRTMRKLGERFEALACGSFSPPSEFHLPPPSWQDWVFDETRRRMTIVCFLISLVVGNENCVMVKSMHTLYLPSKKTLWEARTEDEWRREYETTWAEQRTRELDMKLPVTTVGDLLTAKGNGLKMLGLQEGLDSWYSGLDGLGIMLASVLIGE